MTKFIKKNFDKSGQWLYYKVDGQQVFVARLRNRKQFTPFINFLIDNFTVEEYFTLKRTGLAPLEVVKTKGYESVL